MSPVSNGGAFSSPTPLPVNPHDGRQSSAKDDDENGASLPALSRILGEMYIREIFDALEVKIAVSKKALHSRFSQGAAH